MNKRRAVIQSVGTVLSGIFMGSVASAQAHVPGSPGLSQCAQAVQFMPVTYTFPSTTNTLLTATVPGKTSTGSCKDYTWLDVPNWATRIIFLAEWAGPNINTRDPVSNGWDCKHSAMTYGIYRKSNTTNTYALVAQSQAYGVFDEAKKQCNHPFSVPQSEVPKPVGTQLIDYNTSPTKYRYRIAVQAWQHNDPDLAHLTQACGTALNCYWPTKVSMASIP